MSKFVFVLGAGASADSGAPMSLDFMDKAERFIDDPTLGGHDREAFRLVFKARNELKAVHSKAKLRLDDLESLFNAFEMAALFNRLGKLPSNDVQALPGAMRRVIARTIEKSQLFPVEFVAANTIGDTRPQPRPPLSYKAFAQLLKNYSHAVPGGVSVITFNYDLALDYALWCTRAVGAQFRYALAEDAPPGLDLLKLHGSLNWRRCGCNQIVALDFEQLRDHMSSRAIGKNETTLEWSLLQPVKGHCYEKLHTEPIIVPPTWNKGQYHAQLSSVWRRAAQHFSDAEYIFIMGYSYPNSDEFFRYLYALGSVGDGWPKQVFVFNPAREVEQRIRELLGPLAENKFTFRDEKFREAVLYLKDGWPERPK